MSAKEQETEVKRTTPGASSTDEPANAGKPSTIQRDKAEDDDITMGDEAQKRRDKMQHQEKAEGDRR